MTTPRNLVLKTLRMEPAGRVPWVPFVGCHAAYLLGIPASEYLKSADRMVEGVKKAVELYKADGLPVTFDLQIEAEALGCGLVWSHENPPAVSTHPVNEFTDIASLPVLSLDDARIPAALEATRRLRADLPDVALYGLVTGPFTLALHLVGANLFVLMFEEPDWVKDLLDYCARVAIAMSDGYIDAGCDVIAVVDPMTSQISPDQFVEFVTPSASRVFRNIRKRKCLGSFFVCGHAQKNIEVMCDTGPDNLSVDENIPLGYVRDICLPRGISYGGNLRLTTVMLLGSPEDNAGHAAECMEIGGTKGFVLAPGCDIPHAVPPKNIQAISNVVHDEYQRRVALELFRLKEDEVENDLDLSEYDRADKVYVDIITLDSESCAPCQYMVEAVRQTTPHFEGRVIWREHKIKRPEGIAIMRALTVRNVPTICIDGEIKFVSRIPPRNELVAAIQARVDEKLGPRGGTA